MTGRLAATLASAELRRLGGWMGFVSFSPDGTIVASEGPTMPDDVSSSLTLWNFLRGD